MIDVNEIIKDKKKEMYIRPSKLSIQFKAKNIAEIVTKDVWLELLATIWPLLGLEYL